MQGAVVTVVDAATVKVEKPSADATMLSVLALPEAAIVSRKWVEGGANLKLSANGTGPFQLKSYEPAVRASLTRNPRYFVSGQPYLDGVDFRMIKSDDARVNALRSQSLDMIDFVPWKDIDVLRRNAGTRIDTAGGAFMSVWFNTGKKPFDDARVRRAVSYAIDREAVSKAAFFGYGKPIYGAPTPEDSPYYDKSLDGTYKRDTAKARALLAEAGYGNGVDASMVVFQGLGIYTTMAQVVQANLKEVGINLKLEPVEWATLVERKNRGDYESMIYGVSVKLPDPDAYAYYLGGDSSYWAKPIGYRDPELEKLLAQGRALTDPKARQPIYQQAEKRILETSPWVFVSWREQAQGYLRKVQGYTQLGGALSESSPGISLPTMWPSERAGMLPFLLRRLGSAAITLALATGVVFIAIHLLPGDPVAIMLGDQAGSDPVAVARVRAQLGLDLPLGTQFTHWAGALARGDLGVSLRTGEPVADELARRIPRSLELIGAGLLIAVLLGVPLGVVAARSRGRLAGALAAVIAVAGFSAPVFVLGILLVLLFSLALGWLPSSGFVPFSDDPLQHCLALILPSLTIGLNFMGVVARMTRASLADVMGRDYVKLARAKGMPRGRAILRHALPNALVPVIAIVGVRAGNLLGGTVIIEALFDWPGLSSLLVSAAFSRDYPVIQGSLLAIFALFILISLVIDLAQGFVDPRIRRPSA
ncbi:ABC transporter substrate-binding protein [Achromobacter xylosoxidans]